MVYFPKYLNPKRTTKPLNHPHLSAKHSFLLRRSLRWYLGLIVVPGVVQIGDSQCFPLIVELFRDAIDDSGHFVGDDELQVLRNQENQKEEYFARDFISEEEAIFDSDCPSDLELNVFSFHLRWRTKKE